MQCSTLVLANLPQGYFCARVGEISTAGSHDLSVPTVGSKSCACVSPYSFTIPLRQLANRVVSSRFESSLANRPSVVCCEFLESWILHFPSHMLQDQDHDLRRHTEGKLKLCCCCRGRCCCCCFYYYCCCF